MKITINPTYNHLHGFIASIPFDFDRDGQLLFQGRNTVRKITTPDGLSLVIKRYKRPNIIQRISYTFFKQSKAKRAFLFAKKINDAGIDTPQGIAYIEIFSFGLLSDSFFISTNTDYKSLYEYLVDPQQYDSHLADELARFLVKMHLVGILHGDVNLKNILFSRTDDAKIRFCVIDTNRSHFKTSPTRKECIHNLVRLTHRRDLLQYVVSRYASLRGWDPEKAASEVIAGLDHYEHHLIRRRKLKRMLPNHNHK